MRARRPYKLRWRPAGGEFEAANAITTTETNATITLSAHGEWEVRLQGCNDTGCGPEASQSAELSLLQPPANFAVSVQRGKLDLWTKWDAVEGATSYKLRWRQGDGEFEAANAITTTETEATITVSGYGEWEVRLQACNAAGCVPEAGLSSDDAQAVSVSLAPAPGAAEESGKQTQAKTITARQDPVPDDASYTVGWGKDGPDFHGLSQPGDAGQPSRAASDPPAAGRPREASRTDTTPPRLISGTIDGDTMTFYFSEALDEDATGSQFRVTLDWGKVWANFTARPTKVEVSGNKVEVVGLSYQGWPGYERAGVGTQVSVYYYIDDRVFPAGQRLRDLAGNEVLTPHGPPGGKLSRTRTIELNNLTAPPALQSATAQPHWLTLTFDETLHGNSVPAGSAFTVEVNGSAVSLANMKPVHMSGDTVTLVLAAPVAASDTVTVSYTQPSDSPLRGPDGAAKGFPARSATNRVGAVPSVSEVAITSVPAANATYAPGETIDVEVTFTEAVDVTGTPRLRIKLDPNHGEQWADYAGRTGTDTLTFTYTVVEPNRSTRGVAVLRGGLELNGGAIRAAAATPTDAHLWYGGLNHDPNHKVDWRRSGPGSPWVTGVAITSDPGDDDTYRLGDTIQVTVTYSEAVDVTGEPRLKIQMARGNWWMGSDSEERWAKYTGSSSDKMKLTFAYTVKDTNHSPRGVAVLRNSLELNGGTIRSTTTTPTGRTPAVRRTGPRPEPSGGRRDACAIERNRPRNDAGAELR